MNRPKLVRRLWPRAPTNVILWTSPRVSSTTKFSPSMAYYREDDGGWLADTPALPGVTAYGRTEKQATASVQALALRLIADRLEHGEALPGPLDVSFVAA